MTNWDLQNNVFNQIDAAEIQFSKRSFNSIWKPQHWSFMNTERNLDLRNEIDALSWELSKELLCNCSHVYTIQQIREYEVYTIYSDNKAMVCIQSDVFECLLKVTYFSSSRHKRVNNNSMYSKKNTIRLFSFTSFYFYAVLSLYI